MNMNHASFMDGGDDESYFASGTDIDTMSGGYSSAGESLVSQGDLDYLYDDQSEQVGGYNSDELDVDIIQVGGASSKNESGRGSEGGDDDINESEVENSGSGEDENGSESEHEEEDGTPSAEVAVATVASSLHSNVDDLSNPSRRVSTEVSGRGTEENLTHTSGNTPTPGAPGAMSTQTQGSEHNVSNGNNATSKLDLTKPDVVKNKLEEMIESTENPLDKMNIGDVIDFVLKQITTNDPKKKQLKNFE